MADKTAFIMDAFVDLVESNPDKHFDFTAEGEIIEVSPKLIHGLIQAEIAGILRDYLRANPLGRNRVVTEVAHHLDGWPCRPDVSIDLIGEEAIPTIAPLLAVEIKSDSNTLKDLRAKARKYLEKGTSMVWVVLPEQRMMEVYQVGADDRILTEHDTLSGASVLPGFGAPVRELLG
ncbi:MAG: Uma2 family endonuclease [Anaerolineae bacterium]|nr:Uma2 family endonuclease [Anaerolineae bacterium]